MRAMEEADVIDTQTANPSVSSLHAELLGTGITIELRIKGVITCGILAGPVSKPPTSTACGVSVVQHNRKKYQFVQDM
jgi:hypothetical protein